MTEDEWVQRAIAEMPPTSETKKVRLALIFRDRESENDPGHR